MPWTPSSGLQHMADTSDQVNRQKSAAVTIAPMMRVTHQHVVDRDGAKLECAYQCRCGPLLLLSDNAERCDALCRVAKVMSCRIIVGITHGRHDLGNRLVLLASIAHSSPLSTPASQSRESVGNTRPIPHLESFPVGRFLHLISSSIVVASNVADAAGRSSLTVSVLLLGIW